MARATESQGTDDWYLSVKEGTRGPVSLARLQQLVAAGRLKGDALVKSGLEGPWRRIASIAQLNAVLPGNRTQQGKTSPNHDALSQTPPQGFAVADLAAKSAAHRQPNVAGVTSSSAPAIEPQTQILERLRSALDRRGLASFNQIELEVGNDVVLVRGALTTEGERLLAIHVLQKAAGPVRVISSFTVGQGARQVPVQVPVRSASPKAIAKTPRVGSGFDFAQVLESVKGIPRNHLIAGVAVVALAGFLFIPRGPSRPVAVHPVSGRVILDGQPLANAAIVLHRVGDSKLPANLHPRGKANEDGTFSLETFDTADGAPDGDFVATVFLTQDTEVDGEPQAGPNLLPAVYSKPETSPLKLKITAATKELNPLELTKG